MELSLPNWNQPIIEVSTFENNINKCLVNKMSVPDFLKLVEHVNANPSIDPNKNIVWNDKEGKSFRVPVNKFVKKLESSKFESWLSNDFYKKLKTMEAQKFIENHPSYLGPIDGPTAQVILKLNGKGSYLFRYSTHKEKYILTMLKTDGNCEHVVIEPTYTKKVLKDFIESRFKGNELKTYVDVKEEIAKLNNGESKHLRTSTKNYLKVGNQVKKHTDKLLSGRSKKNKNILPAEEREFYRYQIQLSRSFHDIDGSKEAADNVKNKNLGAWLLWYSKNEESYVITSKNEDNKVIHRLAGKQTEKVKFIISKLISEGKIRNAVIN